MIVINRDAKWMPELAWLGALLAELGHERAAIIIAREYLHSIVEVVNDEQETSMMVERQASRPGEMAISIAFLLGADRELDSSIINKRIVSHIAKYTLHKIQATTPTQRARERERTRHEAATRPSKVCEAPSQQTNERATDDDCSQLSFVQSCSCVRVCVFVVWCGLMCEHVRKSMD